MAADERPIRPAGLGTMRAFAGLHPATGQAPGDLSELDEFLMNQEFEEALLHGRDEGGINSTDADIVISMIRAEEEREENDDDTSSDGASDHLSARELERLPAHTATAHDLTSCVECSVCLMTLNAAQKIVVLPCAHAFHHACIVRWLSRSRRCPYCRTAIPPVADTQAHFQDEPIDA